MRVLLVTSEGACGIAEHSHYLTEAVDAADPSITIDSSAGVLDPRALDLSDYEVCHLNYHSALHSQWTPEAIRAVQALGTKVVVTWHDSGVPNSDHCKSIHAVADAFIVHEPCEDLPGAIYWRQGVPERRTPFPRIHPAHRPIVGTVGFPFGWKNFDLLIEAATLAGWSTLLLAPTASDEQQRQWAQAGPTSVVSTFLPREEVVGSLADCDATAFLYNTHNTGTSGAIRQGIAARKPVIASRFPFGRQFRDLHADPLAARVITWVEPSLEAVVAALSQVKIAPIDAGMVALAEQDSWKGLGQKYAQLYRELVSK